MALTRVSRHIIDEPLELQNINATGIGTFASLRVTGDLQVDGTTTTLDTVVTEVDRLEVSANNSTVGAAITQTGSGDILNLYDGATEVVSFNQYGNLSITSTNPVFKSLHSTGNVTTTLFSRSSYGVVQTNSGHDLVFGTGGVEKVRVTSNGNVGIGTDVPQSILHISSRTSGDATLILEADTDNSDERDNPNIIFRQDGGLNLGAIGMNLTNSSSVGPSNELYVAASSADAAIVLATGTLIYKRNRKTSYNFWW